MEFDIPALALPSAEAEVEAAIRELDAGWDRLPEEALRTCQRHRELATPRLIAVLQEAARLGKEGQVREGCAHDYALYLLTEFRATEAVPAILEVLSLQEPVLDGLLSDTLTELTHRTLAVLAADQPDLIESLLASPHLNEFVRWEAGRAIVQLVAEGRMSRDDALQRLVRQLRDSVLAHDVWGTTIAVSELGDLNPLEIQDEIKAAFDAKLVDESIIDWKHFEEYLLHSEQPGECPELRRFQPSAISDTVELMRGWYCFSEKARQDRERWEAQEEQRTADALEWSEVPFDELPFEIDPAAASSGTYRREAPPRGAQRPLPLRQREEIQEVLSQSSAHLIANLRGVH
jgi:hypothetical protein